MKLAQFAGRTPVFQFEQALCGHTRAWGIFEDRFGTLRRELAIDMHGWWDGAVFVLDEDFHYVDGERQRRQWRVTMAGPGQYSATATDVIGTAIGAAMGNAVRWRYRVRLPVGGRSWPVAFDDWMFLQPDGVIVNRATARYRGLRIGSVSMFIQSRPAP